MLTYADLESEAERLLWERIESGQPVDCRAGDPAQDDPALGSSWGTERGVRAELLIELVAIEHRPSGQRPRALRLFGARIKGKLDLEGVTLLCPLVLYECHLERPIVLDEARATSIRLVGCAVQFISGRQLDTRGDLTLDRLIGATVDLQGARLGGMLSLLDAELRATGKGEQAFNGDRLEVHQQMDCRGFAAEGEVSLVGAHIRGQLSMNGARLNQRLCADGLEVEQDVFCDDGFTAAGEVSLVGAHVRGHLSFNGATLHQRLSAAGLQVDHIMFCGEGLNADSEISLFGAHVRGHLSFNGATLRKGLSASGLQVDQDMFCMEGFTAGEEVRLPGAHVGGNLSFDGATLHQGLSAEALQIDGDMLCRAGFTALGEVSLLGAHVCGHLSFNGATLHQGLSAGGLQVDQSIFCREGFTALGKVSLLGAHVCGHLLVDGRIQALTADRLQVDDGMFCVEGFTAAEEVRLPGAHVGGQLSFNGATLHQGLFADGLQVDQAMVFREGFIAGGEVCLPNAHVGGQLSFNGATLRQGLFADGLQVDQDMFCGEGFTAAGRVRLPGAHIRGQLSFNGATLHQGLSADGLQVDQDMFCGEGFTAAGRVRLPGAHIRGQLSFNGATLHQGLSAGGLQVDQDMVCGEGFTAGGEVRLPGAHVGGNLSFDDATLTCQCLALDLEGGKIERDTRLLFNQRPAGTVNLSGARLAKLIDSECTWPVRLQLRGCEYVSIQAIEDAQSRGGIRPARGWSRLMAALGRPSAVGSPDVRRRIAWIYLAEEGEQYEKSWHRRVRQRTARFWQGTMQAAGRLLKRHAQPRATPPTGGAGYASQPYAELIAMYRQEGRDGDARCVAYERERRRRCELGLLGRTWNRFLQWTVGYGYKPLRTLALLGILVLIGTLAFSSFHSRGQFVPVKSQHPPFVASIYTLDRLIPVVSFGLRDAFAPRGAAQWWAFAYTVLGWVLTIAVVAGLTAAVRRD